MSLLCRLTFYEALLNNIMKNIKNIDNSKPDADVFWDKLTHHCTEHFALRHKLKLCTDPFLYRSDLVTFWRMLYLPDVCNCTMPYIHRTVPTVCRTVPCLDSRSGRSYTCETRVNYTINLVDIFFRDLHTFLKKSSLIQLYSRSVPLGGQPKEKDPWSFGWVQSLLCWEHHHQQTHSHSSSLCTQPSSGTVAGTVQYSAVQ